MRYYFPILLAALTILLAAACGAGCRIITGDLTVSEQMAVRELQRFIGEAGEQVPETVSCDRAVLEDGCIVFGTYGANPRIRKYAPSAAGLAEEESLTCEKNIGGRRVFFVCGGGPRGAVYAAYSFLRSMGYCFFIDGYQAPGSLSEHLPGTLREKPVFAKRGLLPWHNFLDGPTAWDPGDYRAYIDDLLRTGGNIVAFHTYDSEPFAAYREDGKYLMGSRLLSSASAVWGTVPTSTADFAFGTGRLFDREYFGAETTLIPDDDRAIEAEQEVLQDALLYARARGLETCLGFEIAGDPTRPEVRDGFIRRINSLLDTYPGLDYIALWQQETQGAQGFPESYNLHILPAAREKGSPLEDYGLERQQIFRQAVSGAKGQPPYYQDTPAGAFARACEGARLEQFAELALLQLAKRERAPRLVMCGWGGDRRLISAEYYPGLDRLLPESVVFSSLDMIEPQPRIDTGYGMVSKKREKWPVLWLENDGDTWHPQPHVHTLEAALKDAQDKGCRGIMGIHWETADIEEDWDYIVSVCRDRSLTAERYFYGLAQKAFPGPGEEVAGLLSALDSLGYRWVGGAGQNECAPFAFGPGPEEQENKLADIYARLQAVGERYGSTYSLRRLLARIRWVLDFNQAQRSAVRGEYDDALLARALDSYVRRIATRGEYGVLATINAKALPLWKGSGGGKEITPGVIFPRQEGSAAEGRETRFEFICPGEASAVLCADKGPVPLEIAGSESYVKYALVPAEYAKPPCLQVVIKTPEGEFCRYKTVMPRPEQPAPFSPGHARGSLVLRTEKGDAFSRLICWDRVQGADYYTVTTPGGKTVSTATPMFPCRESGVYTVSAEGTGLSESIRVETDPGSGKARVRLRADAGGALLTLSASRTPREYKIAFRGRSGAREWTLPGSAGEFRHRPEEPGEYTVTPVFADGEGRPASAKCSRAYPPPAEKLAVTPDMVRAAGGSAGSDGRLIFDGGYFTLPEDPCMDMGDGFGLSLSFRPASAEGMPVLLSKGIFQDRGWFLQILENRLIFRTSGGDLTGPPVEPGRLYRVRVEINGGLGVLYIDGEAYSSAHIAAVTPLPGPLTLGTYNVREPQFIFRGEMERIVFWGTGAE
ncbi:MAG: hypothetical protein IK083_03070 [Abditibacteriota bacterium]|nr:hypothetical protein [Abditibacteriota bacterium]